MDSFGLQPDLWKSIYWSFGAFLSSHYQTPKLGGLCWRRSRGVPRVWHDLVFVPASVKKAATLPAPRITVNTHGAALARGYHEQAPL